jgi:hypothetical protein
MTAGFGYSFVHCGIAIGHFMRVNALLLVLLFPCGVVADGMVGVPDPAASRVAPGAEAEGARRSIVH